MLTLCLPFDVPLLHNSMHSPRRTSCFTFLDGMEPRLEAPAVVVVVVVEVAVRRLQLDTIFRCRVYIS